MNGVHFHTDDLDVTFEKLRASGAEIVQEPTEQPSDARPADTPSTEAALT